MWRSGDNLRESVCPSFTWILGLKLSSSGLLAGAPPYLLSHLAGLTSFKQQSHLQTHTFSDALTEGLSVEWSLVTTHSREHMGKMPTLAHSMWGMEA